MKRSSLPLLAVAAALLLAALAYGAVWARRAVTGRESTAVCAPGVMEDAAALPGLVLRWETPLTTSAAGRYILAAEGERAAAGHALAILYDTGEEFFRAELTLRLRQALGGEEAAARRERGAGRKAGEDVRRLTAALARQDFSALPAAAQAVRLELMGSDAGAEGRMSLLRAELAALEGAAADAALFPAPASGFFSALTDGWEELSPADALALSPEELRALLTAAPRREAAWGRLVTGSGWVFLALTDPKTAGRFSPGDRVRLTLPGGAGEAECAVLSVRTGEDGLALLAFSGADHLKELLCLRRVTLTAVLERWEGLRLPAAAVWEEDGESWVRRAAGPLAGRTPVTVLARQGGEVLVVSDGLRPGTEVLLQTR